MREDEKESNHGSEGGEKRKIKHNINKIRPYGLMRGETMIYIKYIKFTAKLPPRLLWH